MHTKNILIVLSVAFLVFGNSLSNGFVGDDHVIIVNNAFYASFKNLPKLFTKEYTTQSEAVVNVDKKSFQTGSVAYRPVLSASYFLDFGIWKRDPFGYHLTNLILHLLNITAVYFLALAVFNIPKAAFWSALVFAVHPLKSEPVCAIGYRADLLAALFVQLSLLCYIHQAQKKTGGRYGAIALSLLFFLLALFSKESAVCLPGIILAYDWLVGQRKAGEIVKCAFGRYFGLILITAFYLYVYLVVFPNSSLNPEGAFGGGQFIKSLSILGHYIFVFVVPNAVKVLPPLYSLSLDKPAEAALLLLAVVIIILFVFAVRKNKKIAFCLLYFLLAFIPVSNIIPIVNPVAYRFMYLSSAGLSLIVGWWFVVRVFPAKRPEQSMGPGKILVFGILGLCMVLTVLLNTAWKDNYTNAANMIMDFPEDPRGYMFKGLSLFDAGKHVEAEDNLKRSVLLGGRDPRILHTLGLCRLRDSEESRQYFETNLRFYPQYALSHVGLGRYYLFVKDLVRAKDHLKKGKDLSANYKAYAYLIQIYAVEQNKEEIQGLLNEAKNRGVEKKYLDALKKISQFDVSKLPVDIGI